MTDITEETGVVVRAQRIYHIPAVIDYEKPSLEETRSTWTLKVKWEYKGQRWEKRLTEAKYRHESRYGAKKALNTFGDEHVHRTQVQWKVPW